MNKTPFISAVLPTNPTPEERTEIKSLKEKGLAIEIAFKSKLKATKWFSRYCAQAMGNARWMWNHLVERYNTETERNSNWRYNWMKEKTLFIGGERRNYPWLTTVCADSYKEVFRNFDKAEKKYRSDKFDKNITKKASRPQFHRKKHFGGSFRINGVSTSIAMGVRGGHSSGKFHYLRIPLGDNWSPGKDKWVKLCEPIPVNPLQVLNVTVSRDGEDYYASICMIVLKEDFRKLHSKNEENRVISGLDWGIVSKATIATQTDCVQVEPYKPTDRQERHIKRLQRKLSRKQHPKTKDDAQKNVKSSKQYRKAQLNLRRANRKIANQRTDHERKLVSAITRTSCAVGVENTNNAGMLKNHHLAKAIANVSPYRFLQSLKWAASLRDVLVKEADRFYPSTQKCSNCGAVKTKEEKLKLGERTYTCNCCSYTGGRDENAARNLCALALEEVNSFKPTLNPGRETWIGGATVDVMRADLSALLTLLVKDGLVNDGNLREA